MEQAAEEAAYFISEERSRSRPAAATAASTPGPSSSDPAGINTFALTNEDVAALRNSFPILKDFSDNFIRSTPRGDLMKLQSTSFKMNERTSLNQVLIISEISKKFVFSFIY